MNLVYKKDKINADKYLNKCFLIVDNYLSDKKSRVDSLFSEESIDQILIDPLSTAVLQYYYYKSLINNETVINELKDKRTEAHTNEEFIEFNINYLDTDIMEFNGI